MNILSTTLFLNFYTDYLSYLILINIIVLYSTKLTNIKINKFEKFWLISLTSCIYILSNIFISNYFLIFISIPLYILFRLKNMDNLVIRTLFLLTYFTLLIKISETVSLIIHLKFENINYLGFFEDIITVILLLLTNKVSKFYLRRVINNTGKFKSYATFIITTLIIILITYNFISIYSILDSKNFLLYYIASSTILVFFLIFILISSSLLKNLHIKIEVEAEKQKLEQQKKYIESLEKNNNEIRKFKHDFNNIILGLEGYITNNEVDNVKLRDYFYNNIKDFNTKIELDNIVLSHLNNIKVPSIKNLLTNKIISAQNNDFKINIYIENEIDNFYVNEMQLSRVLGIFLDNSLEAGLELEHNRFLELIILKVNKTIVIQITNTFKNTNLDIEQINESGYSSKGENRGIGLISANDIITKHNMILNTRIKDNLFKQILTIEGEL